MQAFITVGLLPEEVLEELRSPWPRRRSRCRPGYRIEWGGDSDARAETTNNLMSSMGLIVAAFVAAIVITSTRSGSLFVALPVCLLSAGLSCLALATFGYPFGIQALIGVIGSIGVSALQLDPALAAGDRRAIGDVVARAARHVVSTTVTTFGGFLPLILAGGGFWPPFAMATAVSFYFVPPVFALVTRRSASFGSAARQPA